MNTNRSADGHMRSRRGLVAAVRRWTPALRMGWRDALRHKARTMLSILLVMLPTIAVVVTCGLTMTASPSRDRALASIPGDAQAVITATAVAGTTPFPQLPEGAGGLWMDDPGTMPATTTAMAQQLPKGDRLVPYYESPQLIAAAGSALKPGEQVVADESDAADIDISAASTASMTEADAEALELMLPTISQGHAPADDTQIVISRDLADRLRLKVGDTVTLTAPPFNGLMSTSGRIGAVMENSQRAWTVSGITDEGSNKAWGMSGWLASMVENDHTGVDGHYLLLGSQPLTWRQIRELNTLQVFAVSRHVLTDGYPSADEQYPVSVDADALLTRMVSVVVSMIMGVLLMLFLVTPAFTVATDQSRRTLGLAAAAGAMPRDLKRIVTAQGLVIGLIGGVLGVIAGMALTLLYAPARLGGTVGEVLRGFPWIMLPAAVIVAMIVAVAATLVPARRAAALNPVDALRDRITMTAHQLRRRDRMRWIALAGGLLLAVSAVACGWLSLRLPMPQSNALSSPQMVPDGAGAQALLLVLAILLAVMAGTLLIRSFTAWCARWGRHLQVGARLALRDAAEHAQRFTPAATAVFVTVAIASYALVMTGSLMSNVSLGTLQAVHGNAMVINPQLPVNDTFDRRVVNDAINRISDTVPITAHYPVYVPDEPQSSETLNPTEAAEHPLTEQEQTEQWQRQGYRSAAALLRDGPQCEHKDADGYFVDGQDVTSAVTPNTPVTCVPINRSYRPGMSGAGVQGETLVMSADAMRASGFPEAQQAAQALERGEVIVSNAATIAADGTTRIAISAGSIPTKDNAISVVTRKAYFLPGFFGLVMTPETAQKIGMGRLRYWGDYIRFDGGAKAADTISSLVISGSELPLVTRTTALYRHQWGDNMTLAIPLMLAVLALAATVISLMLSRTQSARDMTTMHAVGASPGFLRRFGVAQAATILLAGVPLGMVAGLALGWFHVAWNRRIGSDGAWLYTVPLWGWQAALAVGLTVIGLAVAVIVTRPPHDLIRRAID